MRHLLGSLPGLATLLPRAQLTTTTSTTLPITFTDPSSFVERE